MASQLSLTILATLEPVDTIPNIGCLCEDLDQALKEVAKQWELPINVTVLPLFSKEDTQ